MQFFLIIRTARSKKSTILSTTRMDNHRYNVCWRQANATIHSHAVEFPLHTVSVLMYEARREKIDPAKAPQSIFFIRARNFAKEKREREQEKEERETEREREN